MKGQKYLSRLLLLAAVGLFLLAGCAPAAKELPSGEGAVWNLVVIGDSSMWEMGAGIAQKVQEDTGVQVVLDDFALPALRASTVLEVLQTGKSPNARLESLPAAVKEAEMVVMFANPVGSVDPTSPLDLEGCFGCSAPNNCAPEAFALYQQHLEAIWAEIIKARAGQPTLLVATDIYNPLLEQWDQCSIYEACNICWQGMSTAARQAAEAHGIPFISRYDAFDGQDHREDPRLKGFIRNDGEHPTAEAGQFFGELIVKLGYQPVQVTLTK